MTHDLIQALSKLDEIAIMINKTETVSNLCAYDKDTSQILETLYELHSAISDAVEKYFELPHIQN